MLAHPMVLALAIALAAGAAGPAASALVLPGPSGPVSIAARLAPDAAGGHAAPPRFAWREGPDGFVGTASDPRAEASVRAVPVGRAAFRLEIAIRYAVGTSVEREAIQLELPGKARALGRDLALQEVSRPLRVDRGTPVLVETPVAVLAGGPGLAAARYAPSGGGTSVELVLDDAASHPFAVYEGCLDKLPGGDDVAVPIAFAALEKKKSMARVERRAGERLEARAMIYLLPRGREVIPLVPERWPNGARAAVVFTDHADRTDPVALRAILHGTSDRRSPAYGKGGFLGHGLKLTKSLFVHAHRGGLDDPATRPLVDELVAAGSEVASHSISGGPDDREAVRAGLATLARLGVTTWIDHQPYTNCEALSNQGWRSDGRYGIRDLLVFAGFRWVWEAGDLAGFASPQLVNLFAVGDPGAAHPPFYPLPIDGRLWVFQSSMFYGTPDQTAAALGEAALDRLERERGLFVGHTYLSASAATTQRPEHLARLLVRERPGGVLELDPEVDAALGRVAAHVRRGALASLTWAEAGDRLRALGEVEVVYRSDGTALVTNGGAQPILGLTLSVPVPGVELGVEGAALSGMVEEPGGSRIWLDLAAGASAVVRASHHELPVAFLPEAPFEVAR